MNNKIYQQFTVLIVEDEKYARDELQELLKLYFGFVYIAEDGYKGLQLINEFNPDIVISDIKMPYMNGIEMLKETKKNSINSIFIFTTAFNNTEYLLDAIDNKADAYLIKPLKFDELLKKIAKVVK